MPSSATNSQWSEILHRIEAFDIARGSGPATDWSSFLPARGDPLYARVLIELIRIDLEYSWEEGRSQLVENYRDRFPELFSDEQAIREVAFEEYRLRCQAGEAPTSDEFLRRFGLSIDEWEERACNPQDEPVSILAEPRERVELVNGSVGLSDERGHSPVDGEELTSWLASLPEEPDNLQQYLSLFRTDALSAQRLAKAVASMPPIGSQFAGFRLIGELGRGAFGRVYLAQQDELASRQVALKVSTDLVGESQSLAQLLHTNVMPIYSVHTVGVLQAVCMPYLGSTTLADALRELKTLQMAPDSGNQLISTLKGLQAGTKTTLTGDRDGEPVIDKPSESSVSRASPALTMLEGLSYVDAVLWIGARLADGLAHAHDRGILHRDLKPANVLLADNGEPMLLDFNLAHDTKLRSSASAASLGGTLPYMAPEHLRAFLGSHESVDARSDIYALGLLLYELLTRQFPFAVHRKPLDEAIPQMLADRATPPPRLWDLNPRVSPAAESIIRQCIEPNPKRRYQSARHLCDDLERQLRHEPLKHAREPSLTERMGKWSRRHPRLASSSTVFLVAAVMVAALGSLVALRGREVARLDALHCVREFRDGIDDVYFHLDIHTPTREHLEEGIALSERNLERYGVLKSDDWRQTPPFCNLSLDDQQRLQAEIGELLLLYSQATTMLAQHYVPAAQRRSRLESALRLSELSLACYGELPVPRALWTQQASIYELLGATDRAAAARRQAAARPLSTSRDKYLAARDAFLNERLGAAIPLLDEAIDDDPRNFRAWFLLGRCHDGLGHDTDAARCYSACVALRPNFPWSYFNRGLVRLRSHEDKLAVADFSHAIRLSADMVPAYINRAIGRQRLGEISAAIDDLTTALDRGAAQTRLYLLRSRLRQQVGDVEGARQDLEEGMRREPADEESFVARGVTRLTSDPKAALDDFDKALAINPRSKAALQNKAHALSERLDRPEEAIAALDRVVLLYPDFVPARGGRGVLLARSGLRDKALRDARECLARDTRPATLYQLAGIYALTSRQEPADRLEAFGLLASALRQGYGFDLLDRDRDLDPIRALPQFQSLVRAAQAMRPVRDPSTSRATASGAHP